MANAPDEEVKNEAEETAASEVEEAPEKTESADDAKPAAKKPARRTRAKTSRAKKEPAKAAEAEATEAGEPEAEKKPAAKRSSSRKSAAKKPAATAEKAAPKASANGASQNGAGSVPRLLDSYRTEVHPVLMREFGYDNRMRAPELTKVVVNIGLGEALTSSNALSAALGDLSIITGQKARENKARKSIAAFKLREGQTIGASVTLRGNRMWDFFDRLVNIALPRVRDFRGVPRHSFDGRGNYTLGLSDQAVFPEIDYNQIDRLRGLQIILVTSARTDEEGRRLLELLGVPFVRLDDPRLVGV